MENVDLSAVDWGRVRFDVAYGASRRYDEERNANIEEISKLPWNQQPLNASYWMNRMPRPYIPEGMTFEQWQELPQGKVDGK